MPLPVKRVLPGVKHVVMVASGKGGVGKSTVSTNLALAMSSMNLKIGLLDADLFGPSIPILTGLKSTKIDSEYDNSGRPLMLPATTKSGLKCMSMGFLVDEKAPVVWRGLMVMKAIKQLLWQVKWDPLDILIIDMPPGTGDTQLSIVQQLVICGALMVTTPQELSLADARKAVEMLRKTNVPILGYVENMTGFKCSCCSTVTQIFPQGLGLDDVEKLLSIPIQVSTAQNCDNGLDHPTSEHYIKLAHIIMHRLQSVQGA